MQQITKIPYEHWSLKIGRSRADGSAPDVWGAVVTALDDLHQAITNLILTPLGSVPTEPEMGCDLTPYIDRHPDIAVPNLTRAIWEAIKIWEPRVALEDVRIAQVNEAHFAAQILWRPTAHVMGDLIKTGIADLRGGAV